MKQRFAAALAQVLKSEGGYVNDPDDPGGATNKGITQHVYDDWRIGQGLDRRSVRLINDFEMAKIYKSLYWDKCNCDQLPAGLDYAVFDFAVNSGVNRAARFLQRIAGVVEDGAIGPQTLQALLDKTFDAVLQQYCDLRREFLRTCKNFTKFGNGWLNRVDDVEAFAKQMHNA